MVNNRVWDGVIVVIFRWGHFDIVPFRCTNATSTHQQKSNKQNQVQKHYSFLRLRVMRCSIINKVI